MVAPGGMGTLDELFEVLTLKQTGKVQPDLPVVLFGKAFWKKIINWEVRAPLCLDRPMPPKQPTNKLHNAIDRWITHPPTHPCNAPPRSLPQAIAEYGVISEKDVSDLFFADTVDEAYEYLLSRLTKAPANDVFQVRRCLCVLGGLVNWLFGCLFGCLIGWLVACLVRWSVGCWLS